jgi:hypothetical protein
VSVQATDPSSPFLGKHFQYSIDEYALAATMQALDDALSDAAYHDEFFKVAKVSEFSSAADAKAQFLKPLSSLAPPTTAGTPDIAHCNLKTQTSDVRWPRAGRLGRAGNLGRRRYPSAG